MKKMLNWALIVIVLLVIGCSGSTEPENPETGSNAPTNLVGNYNWNVSVDVICSVDLIWDAPEEPDTDNFEYRVYRNDQLLITLTSMQNYYTDVDCIPGGDYSYYITVYYSSGESEPSNIENVLFDMSEILIANDGHWSMELVQDSLLLKGYSMYFSNDSSFTYSYSSAFGPGWTYYGSFSVDHDLLSCTYLDSNQTEHTINGIAEFISYNLMNYNYQYGYGEWERVDW